MPGLGKQEGLESKLSEKAEKKAAKDRRISSGLIFQNQRSLGVARARQGRAGISWRPALEVSTSAPQIIPIPDTERFLYSKGIRFTRTRLDSMPSGLGGVGSSAIRF